MVSMAVFQFKVQSSKFKVVRFKIHAGRSNLEL
jgi:hypothetical protein